MPVQFPTFSSDEQAQRSERYANNTLYPYSYSFFTTLSNLKFPFANSSIGTGISYFTIGFQADNNLAISALQVNLAIIIDEVTPSFYQSVIEISYASVLDPGFITVAAGVPAVPTDPSDKGNIIYRNNIVINSFTLATTATPGIINDYRRFEPYNYLVKFNQIVYIHVGIDTTAINKSGSITGGVIFHTLPTGAKT